jgi:parallel beta-helix repeat protein
MRYSISTVLLIRAMCTSVPLQPSTASSRSLLMRLDPDSAVVGQGAYVPATPLPSEFPNIQILPSPTIEQSEMSIAINPANRSMLLVGANTIRGPVEIRINDQGAYYSDNAGLNWSGDNDAPSTDYISSDPAVAFNADGIACFNYLHRINGDTFPYEIVLSMSDDGGASWTLIDTVHGTINPDKNHMAIDLTSPAHRNNIYTAYTEFKNYAPPIRVYFSRMLAGQSSFSQAIPISGNTADYLAQGANIAIGPQGQVYVIWSVYDDIPPPGEPPQETGIGFTKSENGGQNFSNLIEIAGLDVVGVRGYIKPWPYTVYITGFPSMAVDTVACSPNYGKIYVAWTDGRNGEPGYYLNPDIYLARLDPDGSVDKLPRKVNDDVTITDQWFPWVTVDPNGVVHVVFYDSRVDPDSNLQTAVYMASSYDGGQSFAENVLISDVAFTPSAIDGANDGYMGDYIGVTSDDGFVYPCWNDNRDSVYQAFMAIVPTCDNMLSERTIWSEDFTLEHDVLVCPGETLFVDNSAVISITANADKCPRNEVSSAGQVAILVKGTLWANGATFESDAPSPTLSDWAGIHVLPGGTLRLENCVIRHAESGIQVEGAALADIDHCVFQQNEIGVLTYVSTAGPTTITYCDFTDNETAMSLENSDQLTVRWNTITGSSLDGIVVYNSTTATIERNIIDGANGVGIDVSGSSGNPYIIHNDIVNCGTGIRKSTSTSPMKINCIVTGNTTGVEDLQSTEQRYNDVWNNGTNYVNSGPGEGDLSSNPRFVDPANGDYHLQGLSPCIDRGDPLSDDDPDGTRADIGVYYYPQGGGGGGGCPYVYTWNGQGYVQDNTILTESERLGTQGPVTDYYRLRQSLVPVAGEYRLLIREFENERTYLDAVELIAVDHPAGTRVGATPGGTVFLYSREHQPIGAVDKNGDDVLERIAAEDGNLYQSSGPGTMRVRFSPAESEEGQLVITSPAPAGDSMFIEGGVPPPQKKGNVGASVRVDVEDQNGNWHWGDVLPARGNPEDALWLLCNAAGSLPDGELDVRLRWQDGLEIDQLAMYEVSAASRQITRLEASSATHSQFGDVLSTVTAVSEGSASVLTPGQQIEISFPTDACPSLPKGWRREFILRSHGYYESLEVAAAPNGFRLYQNHPNPFNSGTTIEYTLLGHGKVRIDIYNILGQFVKTLIDADQVAGTHTVVWEGRDAAGRPVASGFYLCKMAAGGAVDTRKMLLIK